MAKVQRVCLDEIIGYFDDLEDPRDTVNRKHPLVSVVVIAALYFGKEVLIPITLAILLSFVLAPLADLLRRAHLGRVLSVLLAVLIALEDALDQYLMREPAYFFGRPVEHATVDPENPYILAAHLRCAASEIALWPGDEALFGPRMREVAEALEGLGALVRRRDRWHAPSRAYPGVIGNSTSLSSTGASHPRFFLAAGSGLGVGR